MKTYWPDYYKDFHCKAGECRHTCCRGWLIEIDKESLERFSKDPGIAPVISDGCFSLKEDGRCPFLRDDNLCQMIIDHGEDYLCDICREHPRFYDFCDSEDEECYEAGISLSCEEACRLILSRENGFTLVSDDGEDIGTPECVGTLFDKEIPVLDRLRRNDLIGWATSSARALFFSGLEMLDLKWGELLKKIVDEPVDIDEEQAVIKANEREFVNFAAYLCYRYAYYNGGKQLIGESVCLLADLVARGCDIYEAARMFSSEIEYSDENVDLVRKYFYLVRYNKIIDD